MTLHSKPQKQRNSIIASKPLLPADTDRQIKPEQKRKLDTLMEEIGTPKLSVEAQKVASSSN
jgi:hypothetical protein